MTRVINESPEPYLVNYRLRKNSVAWLVIDVIVEDVSMISNFRTQMKEIISEVGPDGLIDKLKAKNDTRDSG